MPSVKRSPYWNHSPAGLVLGMKSPQQLMEEGRVIVVDGQPLLLDRPVMVDEPERRIRRSRARGVVCRLADRRPPRCLDVNSDELLVRMARESLSIGGMGWVQSWHISKWVPLEVPWKVVAAKLSKLVRQGLLDGCTCGCRGDFTLTPAGIERVENQFFDGEIDLLLRFTELARP